MLCEVFVFVIKCNPTHLVQNKNEWSWQERRNITQANSLSTSWLITLSSLSCQLIFYTENFPLFEFQSLIHFRVYTEFKSPVNLICSLYTQNEIVSPIVTLHKIQFTSFVIYDIMRVATADIVQLHSYPRPHWHWLLCSESVCPLLCLCGGGQRRVCTVYCDHYPALTLWWFQLINVDIQQSIMSGMSGPI